MDIRLLSRRRALLKQLCEVLKYPVKFASLPGADGVDAWEVGRGRRLFQSWGCLWGMASETEEGVTERDERVILDGWHLVLDEGARAFRVVGVKVGGLVMSEVTE